MGDTSHSTIVFLGAVQQSKHWMIPVIALIALMALIDEDDDDEDDDDDDDDEF